MFHVEHFSITHAKKCEIYGQLVKSFEISTPLCHDKENSN
jgi:hypothetical protein